MHGKVALSKLTMTLTWWHRSWLVHSAIIITLSQLNTEHKYSVTYALCSEKNSNIFMYSVGQKLQ